MNCSDILFDTVNSKQLYQQLWQENKLSFMQSWAWGEFKSSTNEVVRFKCTYDQNQSFVVTIFIKNIPILNIKYGYIPKFATDKILQRLNNDFYRKLGYFTDNDLNLKFLLFEFNASSTYGYNFSSYMVRQAKSIQPNETDIILLNAADEEMLDRMDKGTRYEIRKAVKKGCRVSFVEWTGDEGKDKETVKRFFSIMQSIYDRTNYVMYGEDYFFRAFTVMGADKMCRILFVQMDGQDIGAMMHYMDVDTVYEVYGGVNNLGRKVSANYLLKWEAIKHSRKEGYEKFDQWGVAPLVVDADTGKRRFKQGHSLYYISKFKSGFGGQYTEFIGQWAYIMKSGWFWVYRFGVWLNRRYIHIYSFLRKCYLYFRRSSS